MFVRESTLAITGRGAFLRNRVMGNGCVKYIYLERLGKRII